MRSASPSSAIPQPDDSAHPVRFDSGCIAIAGVAWSAAGAGEAAGAWNVDTAVAGLLTLMEPIMIAVLGGVVGGIVIAMYMPIFDLISKLT